MISFLLQLQCIVLIALACVLQSAHAGPPDKAPILFGVPHDGQCATTDECVIGLVCRPTRVAKPGVCCRPNEEAYAWKSIAQGPKRGRTVWRCRPDIKIDANNCGQPNKVCPNGQICQSGKCFDPNDNNNCGSLGHQCASGQICRDRNCVPRPSTNTDCGSFGSACKVDQVCVQGTCYFRGLDTCPGVATSFACYNTCCSRSKFAACAKALNGNPGCVAPNGGFQSDSGFCLDPSTGLGVAVPPGAACPPAPAP